MIIERIRLCNITSIEGEHTIDFTTEPLRSAGLFAITGHTGAGKSSILDAICLALYNQAPRLDEPQKSKRDFQADTNDEEKALRPHDPRNFLRRGAKEGYAYLQFVGNDGLRYEAQWAARINRNGNLDDIRHSLLLLDPKSGDQIIAQQKKQTQQEVQRVLGLDYQQFSRTVILAQNSFAAFLQARNEEKGQLLEKLTGTEIYGRISQRIYELHDEAKLKVRELEAEQAGALIGRLSEADEQEHKARVAHLGQTLTDHLSEQKRIAQLQEWYAQSEAALQRVQHSTQAHNEVNKQYLALRGEQQLLERYDQVLEFRDLYVQIQENRAQIEHNKKQEAETAQHIQVQKLQTEQTQQQLLIANERQHQAENQLQLRQNDIARGHELEGEIASLSNTLDESEKQLQKAQQLLDRHNTEHNKLQQETERLKSQLETLSLHRQALSVHQAMFEQYQAINEKLSLYNSELRRNDRLQKELNTDTQKYRELTTLTEHTQQQLQDQEDALKALRAQRDIDLQAIADLDESRLHRTNAESLRRLALLGEARRHWQRLTDYYERTAQLSADIERCSRQLEQRRTELHRQEQEEQELAKRYLQLSQSYILSQSQDIKNLRQMLQEGVPCPVCGSAHHPLHTEVEQILGEKQSQLEQDYRKAEARHKAKEQEVSQSRIEISAAHSALMADKQNLEQMCQGQRKMEEQWQHYATLDPSFAECNSSVNRDARTTTIDMLTDSTTQLAESTQKDIERYEQHHRRIVQQNANLDAIGTRAQELREAHAQQKSQLTILRDRIDLFHRHIDESNHLIEQLYKTLDDLLTMSGWRDDDLEHFSKRFAEIYAEWNQLNLQLQRTEQQLHTATLQSDNSQQARKEAQDAVVNAREERDRKRESLAERHEQLQRLFGQETPSAIAHKLQQQVAEAAQQAQNHHQNHHQSLLQLQNLNGQNEHLKQARHQQEEQLRERSTLLDQAIARFNLNHTPLRTSELEALFTDTRNWNELREQITHIKDQLTLATQCKNEAEKAYLELERSTHRPSQEECDSLESLSTRLAHTESLIEQTQSERSVLQNKLNQHATCLSNAATIEATIATARENAQEWERLKVLFGAKDGKRFRDLAQSYTFSLLVEHANYHLRMFSPRYSLQVVRGTLSLEAIDHEMLDERRAVASLSGGETFIVSLALALGLASLSGTLLNMGHLFIDEGFGQLDEASLALVLDALSSLEQHQGRKVGVVSHTEQIRQQIHPQIQLHKEAGTGRSQLHIVS